MINSAAWGTPDSFRREAKKCNIVPFQVKDHDKLGITDNGLSGSLDGWTGHVRYKTHNREPNNFAWTERGLPRCTAIAQGARARESEERGTRNEERRLFGHAWTGCIFGPRYGGSVVYHDEAKISARFPNGKAWNSKSSPKAGGQWGRWGRARHFAAPPLSPWITLYAQLRFRKPEPEPELALWNGGLGRTTRLDTAGRRSRERKETERGWGREGGSGWVRSKFNPTIGESNRDWGETSIIFIPSHPGTRILGDLRILYGIRKALCRFLRAHSSHRRRRRRHTALHRHQTTSKAPSTGPPVTVHNPSGPALLLSLDPHGQAARSPLLSALHPSPPPSPFPLGPSPICPINSQLQIVESSPTSKIQSSSWTGSLGAPETWGVPLPARAMTPPPSIQPNSRSWRTGELGRKMEMVYSSPAKLLHRAGSKGGAPLPVCQSGGLRPNALGKELGPHDGGDGAWPPFPQVQSLACPMSHGLI
ncbi:hypothetical protein G7046_g4861 [Stylonectria norvegica]|nr:hypothetical protein G7046_g4861 [Stylonectria norvegica]